ncbi:MAG: hypothetical protein HYX27_00330 [Acidobacteria bacterium]|nr:hypothetical protein [Acidobacteriota bacterium]
MMNRRSFAKSLLAAPVLSTAVAQEVARRTNGLPKLTIKDAKVIPVQ